MRAAGGGRGRGSDQRGGGEGRMVRERRRKLEMGGDGAGDGEGDVLGALIEHGGMNDDEIATTLKDVGSHLLLPSPLSQLLSPHWYAEKIIMLETLKGCGRTPHPPCAQFFPPWSDSVTFWADYCGGIGKHRGRHRGDPLGDFKGRKSAGKGAPRGARSDCRRRQTRSSEPVEVDFYGVLRKGGYEE